MKHKISIIDETLEGATEVLWTGYYTERPITDPVRTVTVTSDDWGDEEAPLRLNSGSERDLTEDEATYLCEKGAVTHLRMTHPRADRYGGSAANAHLADEHFAKVILGNLGFCPSVELDILIEDSGDDSGETYVLTFEYPFTHALSAMFNDKS